MECRTCRNPSAFSFEREKIKLTGHAPQELRSEALDMTEWKRVVRILFEKVEDGGGEKFGNEADVILVVEEFDEMDTVTAKAKRGLVHKYD